MLILYQYQDNSNDVTNRMWNLVFVGEKMIKCILSPLCVQLLSIAAFVGPTSTTQTQKRGNC